jgi:hypothetical protein
MTAMTAITAGSAATSIPAASRAKHSGLMSRLWASFIEARMRQAEREIALHSHLLPRQFQLASERLAYSEKELPFVR